MALFGKRRDTPPPGRTLVAGALATARSLPEPTTDRTDVANIRAEWEGQLEGEAAGLQGWQNGMRLFEQGAVPGQRLNVAEYMTRGLAYHLFQPVISDNDALVTTRRVLTLVDQIPSVPAFAAEFGPRLSRLALAIIREKGWQPSSLGGDGAVSEEILGAREDGLVLYSARCPGVPIENTWTHFFAAN